MVGDRDGMPILFLHGLGVDHRTLKATFEPIFSKITPKFNRIYLNLPGMGKSSVSADCQSSDEILTLISSLIDFILEDNAFLLVGESYGGYLARGIMYKMPSRILGAILICPVMIPEIENRTVPPRTIIEKDTQFLSTLKYDEVKDFSINAVIMTQHEWVKFSRHIRSAFPTVNDAYVKELFHHRYRISQNIDDIDPPFTFPSMFLVGRQDSTVGYQDAWTIFGNFLYGSFHILDKAGHNLLLEQQNLVRTLIKDFLEQMNN